MASVSKHVFDIASSNLDCHQLVHPWSKGCWSGIFWCVFHALKGSCQFYTYVYIAQILLKGKIPKKEEWKDIGKQFSNSIKFCVFVSTFACAYNCILKNIIVGEFKYWLLILVPNTISGLAIFLEPRGRRSLIVNLFFNLVVEYWMKSLETSGIITPTPMKQTLFFMVGSAFLFYLMRLEGEKNTTTPLLWFFTPEKVNHRMTKTNDQKTEHKEVCPHRGPCLAHVMKGTGKLFAAGLAITAARVVLPKITSPFRALSSLRSKHLKLALFFGGYIGIYRAVVCLLCHHYGRDSALYALPAGFLAGASFRANPSLGFSIAAVTAAMKLYSTILYEKKIITERLPLPELLFCICQGMLFHARYMDAELCPKYIHNLMATVSNGQTEINYANLMDAIKQVQ